MSPPPKPSFWRGRAVRTVGPVLAGIAAIAALFGVLWVIAVATTDRAGDPDAGRIEIRLGDEVFNAGPAERLRDRIDAGGPLLFPDLLIGGDRYIYLNHQRDDLLTGWKAFSAVPEGSQLRCAVVWQPDRSVFVDPCTSAEYPADGAGLPQYPAFVDDDGRVIIDLTPGGTPGAGTTLPA